MSFTIFYIAGFGVLALVVALLIWLYNRKRNQSYMHDLNLCFSQMWSGREGDELYTWYRIKMDYLQRPYGEKYIHYIDKKISEIDTSNILSGYSVDEFGNIEPGSREKKIKLN